MASTFDDFEMFYMDIFHVINVSSEAQFVTVTNKWPKFFIFYFYEDGLYISYMLSIQLLKTILTFHILQFSHIHIYT